MIKASAERGFEKLKENFGGELEPEGDTVGLHIDVIYGPYPLAGIKRPGFLRIQKCIMSVLLRNSADTLKEPASRARL